MNKIKLAVALAAAVAASAMAAAQPQPAPAPAPAAPEQPVDWRAVARADVLAAYEIYVANHPGMHDPHNPGFAAQLARARDRALSYAERASGRGGYVQALGAFSSELGDGHATLFAIQPSGAPPQRIEWPGFIAAYRGDRVLVHHAGPSAPAPAGSTILGCNGASIRDFAAERLMSAGFRPNEPGQWWFRIPSAFLASQHSVMRPQRCRFRSPDGSEREVPLNWTAAPDDVTALVARATDGDRTPIGLTEPRPGLFLIGMPTYSPNQEEVAAYRALYETVRQRRPELVRARAIVLDLRHNNGGSSSWSRQLAQILWGEQLVERTMADCFRNVQIWWRASPGNIAHMSHLEAQIRGSGNAGFADQLNSYARGMAEARARGEPFFVQPRASLEAPPGAVPASDFAVPVYVITSGRCASACLDAIDVFTRFPNSRLIGAPTSADTTYMEVRTADLPSGRGRAVIPNKLWFGRPRAAGEVYRPHIAVDDLDWSTAGFLDRIERDLAGRRLSGRAPRRD